MVDASWCVLRYDFKIFSVYSQKPIHIPDILDFNLPTLFFPGSWIVSKKREAYKEHGAQRVQSAAQF